MSQSLPHSVRLRVSKSAAVSLIAVHVLAMVAVGISVVPLVAKAGLSSLLAVSMALCLQRHVLRLGKSAIVGFTLLDDSGEGRKFELEYANRARLMTYLEPVNCVVLQGLIVLRLRNPQMAMWLTLPADSMSRDEFRHLRIWLRR